VPQGPAPSPRPHTGLRAQAHRRTAPLRATVDRSARHPHPAAAREKARPGARAEPVARIGWSIVRRGRGAPAYYYGYGRCAAWPWHVAFAAGALRRACRTLPGAGRPQPAKKPLPQVAHGGRGSPRARVDRRTLAALLRSYHWHVFLRRRFGGREPVRTYETWMPQLPCPGGPGLPRRVRRSRSRRMQRRGLGCVAAWRGEGDRASKAAGSRQQQAIERRAGAWRLAPLEGSSGGPPAALPDAPASCRPCGAGFHAARRRLFMALRSEEPCGRLFGAMHLGGSGSRRRTTCSAASVRPRPCRLAVALTRGVPIPQRRSSLQAYTRNKETMFSSFDLRIWNDIEPMYMGVYTSID
jgi:hypothetical protein